MAQLTELQEKVINQLGYDKLDNEAASTLKDVLNYGANVGFSGFIYYYDTCQFFEENENLILNTLIEERESLGYNSLTEMLKSFRCFEDVEAYDIERFLINPNDGSNEEETTLKNGLSWYALEHVAFELEEEISNILDNEE